MTAVENNVMSKAEIKSAIAAEQKRSSEVIKDLTSKLRVIQMEEEARSRLAYKNRKKMLDQTGEWLNKSQVLKVGDLVQVTGSKAGKYRVVAGFTSYGIIGRVARQIREKQMDGTTQLAWTSTTGQVTDQMFNKITHIFRKGTFVSVQELMEQEQ